MRILTAALIAGMAVLAVHLPQTIRAEERKTEPARTDRDGDPLPPDAIARLGSARFRNGHPIDFLAFSRDGQTLLSGSDSGASEGVFRRWEAATGKERPGFRVDWIDGPAATALSPDRKLLALLPYPKGAWPIKFVETSSGKVVRQFGEAEHGEGIAFSADGKLLATSLAGGAIRLWDAGTGAKVRELAGHSAGVRALAFSPDGKLLASAGADKTVRLWDLTTGEERRRIAGRHMAGRLLFSPDGTLLAFQDKAGLHLCRMTTGQEVFCLPLSFQGSIAFSPDGKLLAGVSEGRVRLWETATGEQRRTLGRLSPEDSRVTLAFSPDGERFAAADSTIRIWEVGTGRQVQPPKGSDFAIRSLAFSPDGLTLATGGEDPFIRFWNAATGEPIRRFKAAPNGNVSLAFTADGKTVLSGWAKQRFLWDAATGAQRARREPPADAYRVGYSATGRIMAWVDQKQVLHIHDYQAGEEIGAWPHKQRVWQLRFAPDGRFFAVLDRSGVAIRESTTGRECSRLKVDTPQMFAGFSADSRTIASKDLVIHFVETTTGEELAHTRLPDHLLRKGSSHRPLHAAGFSPDGRMLATEADYEPLRLWEVATGQERHRLAGHRGQVTEMAFSPDGATLATAGTDETALLWRIFSPPSEGPAEELSEQRLQALWADLAAEDGHVAFRAIRTLIAAPHSARSLSRLLHPVPRIDPKRITRLIADLDADDFAVRQRATEELGKYGDLVEKPLRQALQNKPPLEVRRRIEAMLPRERRRTLTTDELRQLRAVEVLEHLRTPEAKRLLERLADGEPEARLTKEARAPLTRLRGGLTR